MAHKTVQFIIGKILTDEEWRARFLEAPTETLAALREMGFEVTNAEIDALTRTDRRLWQSGPDWIDDRLQRCDLGAAHVRPKDRGGRVDWNRRRQVKLSTPVKVSTRKVVYRTHGYRRGSITRLMSPSDLGERLKPFVFLDLFEADMRSMAGSMPVHPHSGIATVTVFTQGDVTFDDPVAGHGTIGYGGLEWARAGLGMWHGKELSAGSSPLVQGFQLWIALAPELERAEPEGQYLRAELVPSVGPARLIIGTYKTATSPVRAPHGINYLLVRLKPGERWTYESPSGHTVAWVAVADGALAGSERVSNGELVIFGPGEGSLTLEGAPSTGATFVLGSAVPHPYELHLGAYSVHTSADALAAGEKNLRQLKARLDATGDRRTSSGSTPVFRG